MPEYDVTAIRFGPSLNFEVYIPEGIAGYGERRWAVNRERECGKHRTEFHRTSKGDSSRSADWG